MVWHNAQDHLKKNITKPVYAHLNTLGHILTDYLDDSLLVAAEYNFSILDVFQLMWKYLHSAARALIAHPMQLTKACL